MFRKNLRLGMQIKCAEEASRLVVIDGALRIKKKKPDLN
jgi:hypothetical protein